MSESMTPSLAAVEELAYEKAFEELEGIVAALETEEHDLETALALYERGQKLALHCGQLLDRAELRVQQIAGDDIIPFEPE